MTSPRDSSAIVDGCAIVLGIPVDDVTLRDAVDTIASLVELGRATGRTHQVATVNVDFLVNASRDRRLKSLLQRADLAIPDGMPVVWGSRLLRTPLRARTTGVDLLPALASEAARCGFTMCLFGGRADVATAAAELLRTSFPGLSVTGIAGPTIGADGAMPGVSIAEVADVGADIVCVALGNPKQEHWIAAHRDAIGAPVFIGIGGTLDFLTGGTRRAPTWMQRSGLEWLHRAASQPRRLAGRYARDIVFFTPRILAQIVRDRRQQQLAVQVLEGDDEGPSVTVVVEVREDVDAPPPRLPPPADPGHAGRMTIDVTGVERPRGAALARIVGIARTGARSGYHVGFRGVGSSFRAAVQRQGLNELLTSSRGP